VQARELGANDAGQFKWSAGIESRRERRAGGKRKRTRGGAARGSDGVGAGAEQAHGHEQVQCWAYRQHWNGAGWPGMVSPEEQRSRVWATLGVIRQMQRTGGGREGWMRTRSLARCTRSRRAGRKGGEAEVVAGCNELGGATHGELPLSVRRSKQEQCDTGLTCDAGLTADSIHFRRRMRKQGNRPRACRLGADGVEAERERRPCEWLREYAGSACTGAVRSRRVSSSVGRGC
jgi:hypothetical protein